MSNKTVGPEDETLIQYTYIELDGKEDPATKYKEILSGLAEQLMREGCAISVIRTPLAPEPDSLMEGNSVTASVVFMSPQRHEQLLRMEEAFLEACAQELMKQVWSQASLTEH